MTDTPPIIAARIDVERRRGELLETVSLLQARLAPRTLAADAWEKAKSKGADLAEEAVDAVKARPAAVGGVAAAVALFLAREPLKDAVTKLYDAMTSAGATNSAPPALLNPEMPLQATQRRPRARRGAKTE